jgi:predicted RNA-binding Zn ribbon-like protein
MFDRDAVAAAGLLLAGEPLAVDLANTIKADDDRLDDFWALEADRLPDGARAPSRAQTTRLREAVRSVLTSHLESARFDRTAVKALNAYAAAASAFPQLAIGDRPERRTAWTSSTGAELALAAAADSAIDVVTGPSADRLRTCGSDQCILMFVATNAKRRWCSSEACGNRERVARHARLAHQREGK